MKILVSGFEPFDGMHINPSQQLAEKLSTMSFEFSVKTTVLPVGFKTAFLKLQESIQVIKPDVIVATGLAINRTQLMPERIAVNVMNARIPDNDGFQPLEEPIDNGGRDGLFSTLPIQAMVHRCTDIGVPAAISNTAGTYVCNTVMYQLLSMNTPIPSGFVHLPPTTELLGKKEALKFDDLLNGFIEMLKAL